ncbi:MAG: bifunctional riboflavin kinase/FAD synthetase, partial [Firmicutes bacterium]|nr:bifunctional riboflavin kinase/FAD synthetase [Bacillota bacterium]
MQVYWRNGSITRCINDRPVVAGLGFFDGVHLGHQAILSKVVELAGEIGAVPAMVTFDRHPLSIVRPSHVPPLLTTARERRVYAWELGILAVCELTFDETLSELSPREFASGILADCLGVTAVVAGDNFHFGFRGEGGTTLLKQAGPEWGIRLTSVVEPVLVEGEVVSSTRIRKLLTK